MTMLEAIAKAKEMRPSACGDETMAKWVNDLDVKIAEVISETSPVGSAQPTNTFPEDRELLMPSPYEDVYIFWLCAMIDFYNQEMDIYSNDMIMFNQFYAEAIAWWRRSHKPKGDSWWRVL